MLISFFHGLLWLRASGWFQFSTSDYYYYYYFSPEMGFHFKRHIGWFSGGYSLKVARIFIRI